jgi:glutathionylspermidine synthase
MKRIPTKPRTDWQKTVESQGMHYHTPDPAAGNQPYWNESAYYQFTAKEIDQLEAATYELDKLCLSAMQHLMDHPVRLREFNIPADWIEYVQASWESDEITIYGRFDLAYDGMNPPKLLEYNADTPTGLLEAAVVQWYWMKDKDPKADQFNSIHEKLIDAWTRYKTVMNGPMMYFSSMENLEDFMTVSYLQDTAVQAGLDARYIQCDDIGWHKARGLFTDLDENQINQIFKLYPWEWMMRDQFAAHVQTGGTKWMEAPWKMVLSNKAILPVLWELFPGHPNLLPASFQPIAGPSVRKPILAREGANILIQSGTRSGSVPGNFPGNQILAETPGTYTGPYVYQQYEKLPTFDGNHAVIGSWMVNGYACGIGIREDDSLVTGNLSRFVPHLFY